MKPVLAMLSAFALAACCDAVSVDRVGSTPTCLDIDEAMQEGADCRLTVEIRNDCDESLRLPSENLTIDPEETGTIAPRGEADRFDLDAELGTTPVVVSFTVDTE